MQTVTNSDDERWYVLRVVPKQEFKSSKFLNVKGIQHYLPIMKKKRQWSDRVKYIDFPVFSGYIFVKIKYLDTYLDILRFKSNIGFIKKEDIPAQMSEEQMFELKTMLEQGDDIRNEPLKKYKQGDKIEIVFGPFKGVKGFITKIKNQHRFSINIELLGRTISTHVNSRHLPVGSISSLEINPEDIDLAQD